MQQDYVCVSTYGQTLDAQLERLRREGYDKVLREKASGAQADRRQLLWSLKGLTRSDVVIVTQIDRLARSTFDLFVIVKDILAAGGSPAHWLNRGPIQPPAPDG
jgi:DNA invertase Pin-like site-specific DNA recombinase